MTATAENQRGLLEAVIRDGRPMIRLTAVLLILCGLFAFFLSATRHFLPHDIAYLGMGAEELCAINECRIVHFMVGRERAGWFRQFPPLSGLRISRHVARNGHLGSASLFPLGTDQNAFDN